MRHLALLPLSLVPLAVVNLALTRPLASFLEARGLFSAENLVRGHLLVHLSGLIMVATLLVHATAPSEYRRLLLLKGIRVALFAVGTMLLLSLESLIKEGSPLTFLTAMVLSFAAVVAWLNYRRRGSEEPAKRARRRLFWLGLAFAFGFAALDEILMIHESIGGSLRRHWSSVGWIQRVDLMTSVYAITAMVLAFVTYLLFKHVFRRSSRYFAAVLLSGTLLFAAAAFFDSCGFLFEGLGTWTDFGLLSSAIEEVLEFLAAALFLVAVSVAFLDQQEPTVRNRLLEIKVAESPSRRAPIGLIVVATLFAVGLAGLALLHRVTPEGILVDGEGLGIEVFAGPAEGLRGARGVAVDDELVYVTNNDGSTVIAFDSDKSSTVLTVPAHELSESTDLVVAGDGTIFLSDDDRFAVIALRPGSPAKTLFTRRDGLRGARGLALGPNGLLFIADGNSSAVFREDGSSLSHYASSLHGLVAPRDLAFDDMGNLYVTDDARKRVFRIGPDGTAVTFAGGDLVPDSIAAWDACLFVADSSRGSIFRIDLEGQATLLARFAQRHRNLRGIAVDKRGSLYVVSSPKPSLPSYLFKLYATDSTTIACRRASEVP